MDCKAGLDVVANKKILPCRELNPGHPFRSPGSCSQLTNSRSCHVDIMDGRKLKSRRGSGATRWQHAHLFRHFSGAGRLGQEAIIYPHVQRRKDSPSNIIYCCLIISQINFHVVCRVTLSTQLQGEKNPLLWLWTCEICGLWSHESLLYTLLFMICVVLWVHTNISKEHSASNSSFTKKLRNAHGFAIITWDLKNFSWRTSKTENHTSFSARNRCYDKFFIRVHRSEILMTMCPTQQHPVHNEDM